MVEERTRQLAAIMFADMVGYTALMQEDEERARSQRDRHREVVSALVPGAGGEILQHYGDGTLCVFGSAVKAVECAVEIQRQLRAKPAVPVRIGVHTGDIVQDEEGVYGDGVNVASRIEALATPGGVLISGKVYDEIKNHGGLSVVRLGEVPLKNVKSPVEIFAISNPGMTIPDQKGFHSIARVEGGVPGLAPERSLPPGSVAVSVVPEGPGEKFILAVRDRAMVQWGLTYLAGAWVVLEIVGFASQQLDWPPLVVPGLGLLAFVGFFIALVVTWFHGERGRQRVKGAEVLMIAALLSLAGLALSTLGPGDAGVPLSSDLSARAEDDGRPRVSVLPFDNFSPQPEDAYFAQGVHEDITTALSRIGTLRVSGRSSVERFRENRPSIPEIADILGTDYLLEGSARVLSGTVRITVQLIDGHTDEHLWAQEFDREFSIEEVISIQSEVAETVAARLEAIITPEEQAWIAKAPTSDPVAYEFYLRGKYHWNMRTEESVREAIVLYEEAISHDAEFAAAHAGLADAFLVLANWGWAEHPRSYARAMASAERALELDSLMANAYASRGGLHLWYTRDWDQSETDFLRAIELDSDHSYSHFWYSALLSALGRHEEAVEQAETAGDLDPLAPPIASGLPRSLFMKGDFLTAAQEAQLALELHPDYWNLYALLCSSLIAAGSLQEAEVACLRQKEVQEVSHSFNMGILRAKQGDRAAALVEVSGEAETRGVEGEQPVLEAMVFAALGEDDAAIELLQRSVEDEYPHLEYLSTHPFFAAIRDDARFQDLLRQIGF